MRKSSILFSLLAFAIIFTACQTQRTTSSIEGPVTIANSFGFGGGNNGLLVQFLAVEDDSRCPADVQCVRAGEAFVSLRTTLDAGTPEESRHEIAPGGSASFSIDRFTVTLLELRPDPPTATGIGQDEYELMIRIVEN